jgi:hypothetical protein
MTLGKSNSHPTNHVDVWSSESPRERLFIALSQVWFVVCALVFLVPSNDPGAWVIELNLVSLLALFLLMIGVWVLLFWSLVVSTRRR